MKRPAVTLENCDTVYDFYQAYDADPRRARFAHFVIGKVYRPEVSYLDDEARDRVRDAVATADVTILASKHVNMNDPLHLVALTTVEAPFADFGGRTVIPSKRPLFDLRIRRWIDDLGAIPTYRRKDFAAPDGSVGAADAALSHATARLVDTCAALMRRGKNLAIFPEAERSSKIEGSDPSKVNPLKQGIAHMYLAASDSVSIAIVPLGLSYRGARSWWRQRRPVMVVGRPLTERYADASTLMADLADAMQAAQTAAHERGVSSGGSAGG